MSTETKCPRCQRLWSSDSEQAACVRVYGHCIVCVIELERSEGFEWSLEKVMAENDVAGLGKIEPAPARAAKKMTTKDLINTLRQGKPMTDRLMREIVRELEGNVALVEAVRPVAKSYVAAKDHAVWSGKTIKADDEAFPGITVAQMDALAKLVWEEGK